MGEMPRHLVCNMRRIIAFYKVQHHIPYGIYASGAVDIACLGDKAITSAAVAHQDKSG